MLGLSPSSKEQVLDALDLSMAIIEFDPSGKVLKANANFCMLMGYEPNEIIGQHHRIFLDKNYAGTPDYEAFWTKLRGGEFVCDEFLRIAKGGRVVYIRGNYNPILDRRGRTTRIVKFANDITATKRAQLDNAAKIDAISRSQAIIEFSIDGTVLCANAGFLSALGYEAEEIVGRNHRMFLDPAYAASADYKAFWTKLTRGEFVADEFKRIGKNGKEVFIQASYNPVFDLAGDVAKVVKFASDVTDRVLAVRRLGAALHDLSEGNLQTSVTEPFLPVLEPIRLDFNKSVETLHGAMRTVRQNASLILAGSNQIRSASDDLARRSEQQAAAVEETSAALSDMTENVRQSSRRADEAGELASGTKLEAEESGRIVGRAVEAMGKIERSSDQIGKIIGVIDEIAFQTNLLALNAGVEAARAGEAGRGFAVVAQEVRGLAQRSAEAAREIKDLISNSRSQVREGVDLVDLAGQSLQRIVEKVGEVNANVSAIVETARSQAVGLQEINVAVGTLDKGIQQNAAMVEESTAACNELSGEVDSLNDLLSQFRVAGTSAVAPASAAHRGVASPVHGMRDRLAGAF